MAVRWNDDQQLRVEAALSMHPVESNRCGDAARAILPVAKELEDRARALLILPHPRYPPRARFVVPLHHLPSPFWTHHPEMLQVEAVDLSRGDL